jgi:DNA-binding response OmpR family regulator
MSRIKILYAEDEVFLGKIVRETLESKGFEVVMVTSGAAVMPAFTSIRPDICVLDIMMPDRNGFEVAGDIRAVDDDVPIIFLTAKTQTEDLVRGFRTGANDYIRKPFSMEELIVRIENTLRLRRDPPQGAMTGGGDIHREIRLSCTPADPYRRPGRETTDLPGMRTAATTLAGPRPHHPTRRSPAGHLGQ